MKTTNNLLDIDHKYSRIVCNIKTNLYPACRGRVMMSSH